MGKSSGFLRRVKLALAKIGRKFGSSILNPGNRIPYTKPNVEPGVPNILLRERNNPLYQRDIAPGNILEMNNKNKMFDPPVTGSERLSNPTNVTWNEDSVFHQPSDGWYADRNTRIKRLDQNNKLYIQGEGNDNLTKKNPKKYRAPKPLPPPNEIGNFNN